MLQALTNSSSTPLLAGGLFAFAVVILALVILMIGRARSRSQFRKRLEFYTKAHAAVIPGKRGQQGRLLIQGKLNQIEGEKRKRSERVTMTRRFEMAGVRITERKFYTLSAVASLAAFVIPLLFGITWVSALLFGIAVGLGLPRLVLARLASKRTNKFLEGFADAVDVIVRGIQSGLPLGECLTIIGRESPEPIAGEFRIMIESTRLGLTLSQAVVQMPLCIS